MIAGQPKSHLHALLASRHCTPITRAAESVFLHRAQAGDRRAVDRLVLANMKFVAAVARNYQNQGLTMEDLIQEGAIGLQRAILKFNISTDNRLISYAVWWIRQAILMSLADQSRFQKIPQRYTETAGKMERVRRSLEQKLGRPPALDEIAEVMGVPVESLEVAIAVLTPTESLDVTVGDETLRIDLMPGPADTGAAFEETETQRNIRTLLKRLDPVDQEILMRHYGLKTGETETMAEIAEPLGLSRERIRQRQDKALERLRRPAEKMNLFTPSTRKVTP